jgi:hypothetical protein
MGESKRRRASGAPPTSSRNASRHYHDSEGDEFVFFRPDELKEGRDTLSDMPKEGWGCFVCKAQVAGFGDVGLGAGCRIEDKGLAMLFACRGCADTPRAELIARFPKPKKLEPDEPNIVPVAGLPFARSPDVLADLIDAAEGIARRTLIGIKGAQLDNHWLLQRDDRDTLMLFVTPWGSDASGRCAPPCMKGVRTTTSCMPTLS